MTRACLLRHSLFGGLFFLSILFFNPFCQASPPGFKQAIGSAYESRGAVSPVWFSVSENILQGVYFPHPDQLQLDEIQFIVSDGKEFLSSQKENTISQVRYRDEGLVVEISGHDSQNRYRFVQEIITDPVSPVLRVRTTISEISPELASNFRLFISLKPSKAASTVFFQDHLNSPGLLTIGPQSSDQTASYSVLLGALPVRRLFLNHFKSRSNWTSSRAWHNPAEPNSLLLAELAAHSKTPLQYEFAIGFGSSSNSAHFYAQTALLTTPFDQSMRHYSEGWKNYLSQVSTNSGTKHHPRFVQESLFARRSLQIMKIHEDKKNRGRFLRSLSDSEPRYSDLYLTALGFLSAGDSGSAFSVLDYMTTKSPNPESQDAPYPILLTAQLKEHTQASPSNRLLSFIKKCAEIILAQGPSLEGRVFPSDIATKIAALKKIAQLTPEAGTQIIADRWKAQIENLTLVTESPIGKNYYNSKDREGQSDELLDPGFLDYVRFGIRSPTDPRILATLELYEDSIRDLQAQSPEWPLYAAKIGHHALAAGNPEKAKNHLHHIEKNSTKTGHLSETVVSDREASCPLITAHAENLILHRSIEDRSPFEALPGDTQKD